MLSTLIIHILRPIHYRSSDKVLYIHIAILVFTDETIIVFINKFI